MPFSDTSYDPDTLAILERAFNEAWSEVQMMSPAQVGDIETTRKLMALRIMDAANNGERDPKRLKQIAVQAVVGRNFG